METESTTIEMTATAPEWARCLGNALIFAGKDETRPALCAVHIVKSGTSLLFEATDSFGAIRQTMSVKGDDAMSFDILAHRADLEQIVKLCKALPAFADVAMRVTDKEISVQGGQTLIFTLSDATFPNLDYVWPTLADTDQIHSIGVNAELMALLAKIVPEGGKGRKDSQSKRSTTAVRLSFGVTDQKPFIAEVPMSGATVILMPTRMS